MPATRVLDILRRGEEYHRMLSAHYQRLAGVVQQEEVRQGLAYLSAHERGLGDRIHAYEEDAPAHVTGTWVKPAPISDLPRLLAEAAETPVQSVEDLARMAATFDESIMQLFRQLAECSAPDRLREALEAVLRLEEEQKKHMMDGLRET